MNAFSSSVATLSLRNRLAGLTRHIGSSTSVRSLHGTNIRSSLRYQPIPRSTSPHQYQFIRSYSLWGWGSSVNKISTETVQAPLPSNSTNTSPLVVEQATASPVVESTTTSQIQSSVPLEPAAATSLPEGTDIGQALTTAAESIPDISHVGQIADFGCGGYGPVGLFQHLLESLHVLVGLPWWASIIVGTLFIRALLSPLLIVGQKHTDKLRKAMPELQSVMTRMKEATASGNKYEATRLQAEAQQVYKKHGVNPFKGFLMIAQFPIFISMFWGVSGMVSSNLPGWSTGGFFWAKDLTAPDPYYILPVLSLISGLLSIEVNARLNPQITARMLTVIRVLAFVSLPVTAHLSAGLFMNIFAGLAGTFVQTYLFTKPSFRTWVKLPPLDAAPLTPASSQSKRMLAYQPMGLLSAMDKVLQAQKRRFGVGTLAVLFMWIRQAFKRA